MSGFEYECDKCGAKRSSAVELGDWRHLSCGGHFRLSSEPMDYCAFIGDCRKCPAPENCTCGHHAPGAVLVGDSEAGLMSDEELEEVFGYPSPANTTFVKARRYTRALKKQLKGWPGGIYKLPCCECSLTCVVAKSTLEEIEAAKTRDEVWMVICDECATEKLPDVPEGITEGQAKEISRVARTLEAQENRN